MGLANSRQEAFWEACGFGATHKVKKLIEEGINVNWVSYTHNSCAIHVASQGKPEIVKMLIDAKCDVNVLDDRGNLALHHAAMKGHADIMQMLLNAGSLIDTQDKNGWTSLINAAYWCQPEAVEVLLKNKCDPHLLNKDERTALHETCRSQSNDQEGLEKIARILIDAGSNVNAKSSDLGEADFTPLMFAAYHGHLGVAQALVDAKCEIHDEGSNKWTALHWAADRNNKEVVQLLLECGLDPLHEGRRGELPLDRAREKDIKEILRKATDEARAKREDDDGEVQDKENSEAKIIAEDGEREKAESCSDRSSQGDSASETDGDNSVAVESEAEQGDSSSLDSDSASSDEKDVDTSEVRESPPSLDNVAQAEVVSSDTFTNAQEVQPDEEASVKGNAVGEKTQDLAVTQMGESPEETTQGKWNSYGGHASSCKGQSSMDSRSEPWNATEQHERGGETAPKNEDDGMSEAKQDAKSDLPTEGQNQLQIETAAVREQLSAVEVKASQSHSTGDNEEELFDENAFREEDYTEDLKEID